MSEPVCKPVGLPPASSLVSSQSSRLSTTANDIASPTSIALPSLNTFQRSAKSDLPPVSSLPSPRENVNCYTSSVPMSPRPSPVNSLPSPMPPPAPSPIQQPQFAPPEIRQNTNGSIPQSSPSGGSQAGHSAPSTPIQRHPQSPSMHGMASESPIATNPAGVPQSPMQYAQSPIQPSNSQQYQPQPVSTAAPMAQMPDSTAHPPPQAKPSAPAPARRRNNAQQNRNLQMQAANREFRQPDRPLPVMNGPPTMRQNMHIQGVPGGNEMPYRGNMAVYPGPSNPQPIGSMMPPPHRTQSQSPTVMQQSTSGQPIVGSLRGPSPLQQGLPVQVSRMGGANRHLQPRVLLQQAPSQQQQQQQMPPPQQQQQQGIITNHGQGPQHTAIMTSQGPGFLSPAKPQMGQQLAQRQQSMPQQVSVGNLAMRQPQQQLPTQGMQPQTSGGVHLVPAPAQVAPTGPAPRTLATAALFGTEEPIRLTPKEQYRGLKRKFKFLVYENECYQDQLRNLQRKLLKLSRDKNFLLDRLIQYERPSSSSDEDSDTSVHTQVDERPKPKKKARPARRRPAASSIASTSALNMQGNPGPSGVQGLQGAAGGGQGPTLGAVLSAKRASTSASTVGQLLANAVVVSNQPQPSTSKQEMNSEALGPSTSFVQPQLPAHLGSQGPPVPPPTTTTTAASRPPITSSQKPQAQVTVVAAPVVVQQVTTERRSPPGQETKKTTEEITPTTTQPVHLETVKEEEMEPVFQPPPPPPASEPAKVHLEKRESAESNETKPLVNGQGTVQPQEISIEDIKNDLMELEKFSEDDLKKEENN